VLKDKQLPIHIPSSLYVGDLLEPQEVAQALENRPDEARLFAGCWFLCGEVSDDMFARMHAHWHEGLAPAVRVIAFCTPLGGAYAVFAHQVEEYQHRMLVPLYDARVRSCLEGLPHLGFSLANATDHRAVVVRAPEQATALGALCRDLRPEERALVVSELTQVVAALTAPEQVPSLRQDWKVRDVSISVVMPSQTIAELKAA
jgi:hypothetical protein